MKPQCRARDLLKRTKLTLMFISREMAPLSPPRFLFLPHSEHNVLSKRLFFTPERTGRLIFALAIKIEEEAPAVSSGELSGRVLPGVPPSCRLTWLQPSAPRLPGCLCLAPYFPPAKPGLVLQSFRGRLFHYTLRVPWTHTADISILLPAPSPQSRISRCSVPGLTILP